MKKLFIGLFLLVGSMAFANNSVVKNVIVNPVKSKKITVVFTTCSGFNSQGDLISVTCSCTRAVCNEKLDKLKKLSIEP